MAEIEVLERMLQRERAARKEAEQLLENKSRELFIINRQLQAAANELDDEVRKTQTIMESATEGMIVFTSNGVIESINPAASNIFGLDQEDLIGKNICRIIPSADYCESAIASTAQEPIKFTVPIKSPLHEYYGVHSEGHAIPLEVGFSEVTHGDEVFFLAMIRDLTLRKELESQLAQSQKLEAVGQLAAGIAHEINTPIQYVGDNTRFLRTTFQEIDKLLGLVLDLLEQEEVSKAFPEKIDTIKDQVEIMDLQFLRDEIPLAIDQSLEGTSSVAKIVRAMKDFSHPGNAEKQEIDLNRTIESTLTVSRNEWKHICELKAELEEDLPTISCFASEINQALLNLLINAAHAIESKIVRTRERGILSVKTYRSGDWVVIEIGDNGCGIPRSIQNRIFDPFFTTKPVGKGTGQGLSIVYNAIVHKHGGEIRFESEEGKGTTFFLRLPIGSASRSQLESVEVVR